MKRTISFHTIGDRMEITGPTSEDKGLPPDSPLLGRHKGKIGHVVGHTQLGEHDDALHVLEVSREATADNQSTVERIEVPASSLSPQE